MDNNAKEDGKFHKSPHCGYAKCTTLHSRKKDKAY